MMHSTVVVAESLRMFPDGSDHFHGSTQSNFFSYRFLSLKPSALDSKPILPLQTTSFILSHARSASWEVCIETLVRQPRGLHAVVRSRQSANVASHGADKDETKVIQQS